MLDIDVARVNVYAAPGGPDSEELCGLVAGLLRDGRVRAISLTAYDPAFDPEGRVPPIALELLRVVTESSGAGS